MSLIIGLYQSKFKSFCPNTHFLSVWNYLFKDPSPFQEPMVRLVWWCGWSTTDSSLAYVNFSSGCFLSTYELIKKKITKIRSSSQHKPFPDLRYSLTNSDYAYLWHTNIRDEQNNNNNKSWITDYFLLAVKSSFRRQLWIINFDLWNFYRPFASINKSITLHEKSSPNSTTDYKTQSYWTV